MLQSLGRVGKGIAGIVNDDAPVLQRDDAVGIGEGPRVVGDHYHGAAALAGEALQEL
jgi:hypothetical protein